MEEPTTFFTHTTYHPITTAQMGTTLRFMRKLTTTGTATTFTTEHMDITRTVQMPSQERTTMTISQLELLSVESLQWQQLPSASFGKAD